VAPPQGNLAAFSLKNIASLPFVAYPGMEVFFRTWFRAYQGKKEVSYPVLQVKGSIENIAGAITLVKHGVGYSVFPLHCIEAEVMQGNVQIQTIPNVLSQAKNSIFIASIAGHKITRRAELVRSWFLDMRDSSHAH
jgi:DNA-binding transcriptional LysR family regulator